MSTSLPCTTNRASCSLRQRLPLVLGSAFVSRWRLSRRPIPAGGLRGGGHLRGQHGGGVQSAVRASPPATAPSAPQLPQSLSRVLPHSRASRETSRLEVREHCHVPPRPDPGANPSFSFSFPQQRSNKPPSISYSLRPFVPGVLPFAQRLLRRPARVHLSVSSSVGEVQTRVPRRVQASPSSCRRSSPEELRGDARGREEESLSDLRA